MCYVQFSGVSHLYNLTLSKTKIQLQEKLCFFVWGNYDSVVLQTGGGGE